MSWRVVKAGSGGATYDEVKLGAGGALICYEKRSEKPYPGAKSEFEVLRQVAFYGPGMWVSARVQP